MTLSWRPWLPEGTLAPASVQAALAELFERWSRNWFAGEPVRPAGPLSRIANPRAELRKTVWHGCVEGVSIGLPPVGLSVLGAMVLDVSPSIGQRGEKDIALLDALGKEVLDDLKLRLSQLLTLGRPVWNQADPDRSGGSAYRLEILTGERALAIQLELSEPCFVRFVRASFPDPAEVPPLADGAAALAGLPVSLAALLGRCHLTLAELAELVPGDVLVLDRMTGEDLPLSVAGATLAQGRCTVVEAGERPALKIAQTPIQ